MDRSPLLRQLIIVVPEWMNFALLCVRCDWFKFDEGIIPRWHFYLANKRAAVVPPETLSHVKLYLPQDFFPHLKFFFVKTPQPQQKNLQQKCRHRHQAPVNSMT